MSTHTNRGEKIKRIKEIKIEIANILDGKIITEGILAVSSTLVHLFAQVHRESPSDNVKKYFEDVLNSMRANFDELVGVFSEEQKII